MRIHAVPENQQNIALPSWIRDGQWYSSGQPLLGHVLFSCPSPFSQTTEHKAEKSTKNQPSSLMQEGRKPEFPCRAVGAVRRLQDLTDVQCLIGMNAWDVHCLTETDAWQSWILQASLASWETASHLSFSVSRRQGRHPLCIA